MSDNQEWRNFVAATPAWTDEARREAWETRATPVPLTVKPAGDKKCLCVKFHVPKPVILHSHHVWPLGKGGPNVSSNLLYLCPTSHNNVHELWRFYDKLMGNVPPTIMRQFSRYVRSVVQRGWEQQRSARTKE